MPAPPPTHNHEKEIYMAVIGKMPKGTPIPHAARPPREEGAPSRAPQPAPAPRGEQHQKETHNTVGRNTGRVR